jgi:hypothetical protein
MPVSPDQGDCMPIIQSSTNSVNPTYLEDVSARDKPWDKHRSNADKVANHYRNRLVGL